MSTDGRVLRFPLPSFPLDQRARRWAAGGLVLGLFLAVASLSLALPDQSTAGPGGVLRSGVAGVPSGQCEPVIDIQGLPAGTIIDGDEFAGQGVHITIEARNGFPDKLLVFDSDSTDGNLDDDLRVGIGNILILPNNLTDRNGDGLVDRPDENNFGGIVTFTFDEPVTIGSFVFVDHDHQPGDFAAAFDAAGNQIKKVFIPIAGNGSVQTIDIDASGVTRFVLDFRDSGGFQPPEECPPGTPTPPGQTPTPPGQTPTPPGQTPTPPGQTPTPPGETPTPPGQTPTPPGQTPTPPEQTPTPPGQTPTPPGETPTPPGETPTPPGETPTPPGETPTPPGETPTPPAETPTPPGETATPTPPVETPTPPAETPTPPGETATPTQPGETPTPPGETPTPVGQTPTPTGVGTPTPTPTSTPTGGASPTSTGTVISATQSPAPTATVIVATPTASPGGQAVAGAVTGPTGPGGVPTTGTGMGAANSVTAKLLIVIGLLLGTTGVIAATSATRKRA